MDINQQQKKATEKKKEAKVNHRQTQKLKANKQEKQGKKVFFSFLRGK